MSKSIVVCTDGTWDGAVGEPASNVLKLFNVLDGNLTLGTPDSPEQERGAQKGNEIIQVAKYIHGVGDSKNWLYQTLGGAIGLGLLSRVLRGYTYVSRNYAPGDSICLVGFSRGAYTARALAGLISGVGLLDWTALNLKRGHTDEEGYKLACAAWYDYQSRRLKGSPHSRWTIVEDFYTDIKDLIPAVQEGRPRYVPGVPIEAIGVWDTVGSLGIPVLSTDQQMRLDALRFADTSLPACVHHGFHAVAADEQRVDFTPTLWDPDPRVVQRFFPGSHGDVGGGYPAGRDSQLSDVALAWMADQLKSVGVRFAHDPPFPSRGSALGPLHLAWTTAIYQIRPTDPREFPHFRKEGNAIAVDDSVRQRMGHVVDTITGTMPPVTHTGPYLPIALVNSGHIDVSQVAAKT
jgi:glutathione S-transferase